MVLYLQSTAAGAAHFQGLTQSTVWKWFDQTKRSTKALDAVESEDNHRLVLEPLGHPHMFVCVHFHPFAQQH